MGSFEHWALTGAVTMLTAIGARVVQHHTSKYTGPHCMQQLLEFTVLYNYTTDIAAGNILGPMDAFVELV